MSIQLISFRNQGRLDAETHGPVEVDTIDALQSMCIFHLQDSGYVSECSATRVVVHSRLTGRTFRTVLEGPEEEMAPVVRAAQTACTDAARRSYDQAGRDHEGYSGEGDGLAFAFAGLAHMFMGKKLAVEALLASVDLTEPELARVQHMSMKRFFALRALMLEGDTFSKANSRLNALIPLLVTRYEEDSSERRYTDEALYSVVNGRHKWGALAPLYDVLKTVLENGLHVSDMDDVLTAAKEKEIDVATASKELAAVRQAEKEDREWKARPWYSKLGVWLRDSLQHVPAH